MFTSMPQGYFYNSCSTSNSFAEMVTYDERIEVGIKIGKIQDGTSGNNAGNAKKYFGGYQKKKEGESSTMYIRKGKGRAYQEPDHQVLAITIPPATP